ncbi:hypothetical protein EDD86DRAFT_129504 [Gorgonomyces haynaldii]|nr:hypothetical protein EDD86DRAFT_129504 [Gorgonomyces haynaldii]
MPVTCNLHGKQSLHQETVQLTFRPIWITVVTIVMNVGFILGANLCTEVFDIERLDDMITSGDANVILCPNMFSRYYDSYKYPSTIMHGLAIYEGLGCIRLLLARLVVDPKVGKTPIFILSCLTCVTIAAYLWTMANTIIFVIDYDVLNAAAAISSNESQAMQQAVEYRFKSMITIVSLHFSMLMTIAVILLRMQPFGRVMMLTVGLFQELAVHCHLCFDWHLCHLCFCSSLLWMACVFSSILVDFQILSHFWTGYTAVHHHTTCHQRMGYDTVCQRNGNCREHKSVIAHVRTCHQEPGISLAHDHWIQYLLHSRSNLSRMRHHSSTLDCRVLSYYC